MANLSIIDKAIVQQQIEHLSIVLPLLFLLPSFKQQILYAIIDKVLMFRDLLFIKIICLSYCLLKLWQQRKQLKTIQIDEKEQILESECRTQKSSNMLFNYFQMTNLL